jgi:hypothetical protein
MILSGLMQITPLTPVLMDALWQQEAYIARATVINLLLCCFILCRLSLLHNNTAAAVDVLTDAVALEDRLGYMEPPRYTSQLINKLALDPKPLPQHAQTGSTAHVCVWGLGHLPVPACAIVLRF